MPRESFESLPCGGWIKTAEAAARLGVSVSTTQRLRRAGRLDTQKRNGRWWFTERSVAERAVERRRWVSHESAAALTGIPSSTVTAAVSRGELHPRAVHRALPSLDRAEVLKWAEVRRRQQVLAEARRRGRAARVGPPDDGRVWLDAGTVALLLNVSPRWVRAMAKDDRLPHVRRGRRLWFLRENMEQVSARRALWRTDSSMAKSQ
jgi:Mn-dependent DtxR family transcriptional regulator